MNDHESPRALLLAALGGLATALAMPPLPLGMLAPVGVALLCAALEETSRPFRAGLVWGICYGTPSLFWIGWVTVPGTLALILISAAEYGLLSLIYARAKRRFSAGLALASLPALFVLLESFRAYGEIGFPWLNLAHTQLDYLWLYQFVEFTGDLALSFWVAALGAMLFLLVRRPRYAMLAVLWVAVPVAWGAWRVRHLPPGGPSVNVAILQGDIDTYQKWDEGYVDSSFIIYDSLTRRAAPGVDLIIWPETAAPTYLAQHATHRSWAAGLAARAGIPLLVGTLSYERTADGDFIFNSAYEIGPDGTWQGPYSKRQLVPFGEMIPGSTYIPALARIDLGQGNFKPGPGPVVFDLPGVPHAVLICYESAFSALARDQVLRGARFLVIITNDSWYGRTSGPAQHAAMASLRAVEFRMGVARAANGGISHWTDRAGRRLSCTDLFTRTTITCALPTGGEPTVYARTGPVFAWVFGLWGLVVSGAALWPRKS
jgi:apolipoprotein N-acyltransferase